jgi:hypothetical protein
MARKPTILTLSEFLKLKGKQKKPVIVYFDEKQWANLTRGLKPTNQKPPRNNTLTFTLTTLPGLGGGFVEIRCPVGGPITGADGELRCGKNPMLIFLIRMILMPCALNSVPRFYIKMAAFPAQGYVLTPGNDAV